MVVNIPALRTLDLLAAEFGHLAIRRPRPQVLFHRQRQHVRLSGSQARLRQMESIALIDGDAVGCGVSLSPPPLATEENGVIRAKGKNAVKRERRRAAATNNLGTEVTVEAYMESLYSDSLEVPVQEPMPASTKPASRLKRRLRRMEAGTHRRRSVERGEVEGWTIKTVEKIKAMEGKGEEVVTPAVKGKGKGKEGVVRQKRAVKARARTERRMASSRRKDEDEEEGAVDTGRRTDETRVSRPRKQEAKPAQTVKTPPKPSDALTPFTDPDPDPDPQTPLHTREPWQLQKAALRAKFGSTGWAPRKRLSPDTLEGIRALHASDPAAYTTPVIAEHFKVTPEAIRRVLKSKWKPNEEEVEERRVRWERRGVKNWGEMAEKGMRPPKFWREKGVLSPEARERAERRRGDGGDGEKYVKWA